MKKHRGGNILKTVGNVLKTANKIAKDSKIISHVLEAIPDSRAKTLGTVAKAAGYGRRKRRIKRRRMRGCGGMLMSNTLGIGYQISKPIF